ncbi:MAG: LysE family translocator [Dysgonamonadaceae bacterium]|jgi:threonine/homoserine/homoserine lactone efflux protein|nr:LysE family translocator [Dysgonamonadaceae bacterium]
MNEFIETIYKGVTIGILVSAPMGPIMMLCIQRTLSKGHWHGFFTGAGAALSDIVYAGIACLGISFITNFITEHQTPLRIIGSLLLLAYGLYIFLSNPTERIQKPKAGSNNTFTQDSITAFFITFSNPVNIILFPALIAQLNFVSPEQKLLTGLLGLSSILVTALLWWFGISFVIGKLRKAFSLRGLWIMNRVVGAIIIILSIVGLIYKPVLD